MTTRAEHLQKRRAHAAQLLSQVARALHLGRPAPSYMPALREACRVVAAVTTIEVAIASDAKNAAQDLAP